MILVKSEDVYSGNFITTSSPHLCLFADYINQKSLKQLHSIAFAWPHNWSRTVGPSPPLLRNFTHCMLFDTSCLASLLLQRLPGSSGADAETAEFHKRIFKKVLQLKLKCYGISITFDRLPNSNESSNEIQVRQLYFLQN